MRGLRAALISSLLLVSGASWAQGCRVPGSFELTSTIRGNAAFVDGGGDACDLSATLNADNSWPGSAFASYSLPHPVTDWRIAFRIDTSQLGETTSIAAVTVLSASTRRPYPAVNGRSALLRLALLRSGATNAPVLWAQAACSSDSRFLCSQQIVDPLISGDLLRFALHVGSGTKGSLEWWVNADFSEPPNGVMEDLDNAAWAGVDTVALGAFQPGGTITSNGTTLRFHQIESTDDTLFWNDFDR